MSRLEGRDDSLLLRTCSESHESILVSRCDVFRSTTILQPSVFGTDTRVIESGRDGVGADDLTDGGLKDVGANSVEDSGGTLGEGGRVEVGVHAVSGGLDSDESDRGVLNEGVEGSARQ